MSSERDPDEIPGYLQRRRIEREASLDFTELQATLNQLAMSLLIIMVPSPEAQDAVMVSRNVNTTLRQEDDFWFLHDYPGNKDYQKRITDFNKDLENSGLSALAADIPVANDSPVGVVLRGIAEKRVSTALLGAWAQLYILVGRHAELRMLQNIAKRDYEHGLKSGAKQSTTGQHVWYARWLLKRMEESQADRPELDARFVALCADLASRRRASPDPVRWPPDWFSKFLQKQKGSALSRAAMDDRMLIDRLDRRSERQLRNLAEQPIPDYLLPPLMLGD